MSYNTKDFLSWRIKVIGVVFILLAIIFVSNKIIEENKSEEYESYKKPTHNTISNEAVKDNVEKYESPNLKSQLDEYQYILGVIIADMSIIKQGITKSELTKNTEKFKNLSISCIENLEDLKSKYENTTNEYNAIYNLQMVFYCVKDICQYSLDILEKGDASGREDASSKNEDMVKYLKEYKIYRQKIEQ